MTTATLNHVAPADAHAILPRRLLADAGLDLLYKSLKEL